MAEAGRSQTPDVAANPKNREQAQPALKGDCALSHSMLAGAQGMGAQGMGEGTCLRSDTQDLSITNWLRGGSKSGSRTQVGPFGTVTLSPDSAPTNWLKTLDAGQGCHRKCGRDWAGAPATPTRGFYCTSLSFPICKVRRSAICGSPAAPRQGFQGIIEQR